MKVVVLDIGGTSIKVGEFEAGVLSGQKEFPTEALLGGPFVIQKAIEIIRQYEGFAGIGISTAGQVDSERGRIRYANSNIPNYTGMEVKKMLETEFHVPAAVENDVNAAAIGEANFGAGKKHKDFLCLTYGTGVGGAIVINREIYTGAAFSAGEFGGILVHPKERNAERDIFSGCYERYASTIALVREAQKIDETLTDGKKIFERIKEEKIEQVVANWIEEIVYGLISLIHIFNPPCIILGGGIMKQKYILDKIKDIIYNQVMESFQDVVIEQASLGNEAGLLGAASLALECIK